MERGNAHRRGSRAVPQCRERGKRGAAQATCRDKHEEHHLLKKLDTRGLRDFRW
jgi:hypothetical protein